MSNLLPLTSIASEQLHMYSMRACLLTLPLRPPARCDRVQAGSAQFILTLRNKLERNTFTSSHATKQAGGGQTVYAVGCALAGVHPTHIPFNGTHTHHIKTDTRPYYIPCIVRTLPPAHARSHTLYENALIFHVNEVVMQILLARTRTQARTQVPSSSSSTPLTQPPNQSAKRPPLPAQMDSSTRQRVCVSQLACLHVACIYSCVQYGLSQRPARVGPERRNIMFCRPALLSG